MIISIHMQTAFKDYDFFKSSMDNILSGKPKVTKCLFGRSKSKEFAEKYFENTKVVCENPKLSTFKIQNLYKTVENSEFSIFFHRDDIKVGADLTKKTISRAKNLKKEFVIVKYKSKIEKTYWLVSNRPSKYDSINAFKNLSEVDWGNASNNHINVGDIVYIYITQPIQKIAIKTIVIKSDFGESELLGNDKQFNKFNELRILEKYIRLKLIKFIDNNLLTIDKLHEHGINGNIQGKRTLKGQTLSYILKNEDTNSPISIEELNKNLEEEILTSKDLSNNARKKRLENANKYPKEVQVISRGFNRNADVIVAVLDRANGFCEQCDCKAPFIRKKDKTDYLEVHHKIQLSDGGEDSVKNAIAVCPNCHRELHFGI